MATSDIALERVQALLKVDVGGGSLHNHIALVLRQIASDKPADALANLETLSRQVKQSTFRGAKAPDQEQDVVADVVATDKRQQWCMDALKIARPPSDPTSTKRVLGFVQNFMEDAAMFEWAGVGFGKQESFQISMSLRKLAADCPSIENLRFWGKIMGTNDDYYVAEGTLQSAPTAAADGIIMPGTPEYDVEPRGTGANTFAYWVSTGPSSPWTRLQAARGSHIAAARGVKKMLTGNLSTPVVSMPWFPGAEKHLLRAQIARISATCKLAVSGYLEVNEDEDTGKKSLKPVEEFEFPGHDDLKGEGGWVHASPFLLSTGKSTWPDLEPLTDLVSEEAMKELQQQQENEPAHEFLEGIAADLEELKPEGAETSPAWSIRVYGDQGLYNVADATKSYRVTAVRSLVWPGAVTVAQGGKFANMYVGNGLKSGTLVPPAKDSGLPLRGTSPYFPLVPDDIMEEPADIEEQEEPNPQQDDGGSDQGDFDNEEGEDAA